MSKGSHRHVTLTALAVVSAAAIGAICTVLVIVPMVPPTLTSSTEPAEVPITMSAFEDPLRVTLVIDAGPVVNLVAPSSGKVTSFECARGKVLESGGSVLAVNDAPLLNFASSTPPWRSLSWGATGADVESVRAEMLRLDAPASKPGFLDNGDIAAFATLLKKIGIESKVRSIELDLILWIPADGAVISSCSTTVGETLSAGQTVATVTPSITGVTVTGMPASVRDGDRELVLDGIRTPIHLVDGSTAEEVVLAAIQASPSYQQLVLGDGDKTQLSATVALAKPIEVASVPAGSIVGVDNDRGCVVAAGEPLVVEILGSQLGQTYISFIGGAVPARIERRPDAEATCG